jgi:DNA-binding transcriptional regulator GbsR (MarR family)
MTDIAYQDIKKGLRSKRLTELKELRKNKNQSLQKSIKERGDENSEVLKELLRKNNDIIDKETEDIQRIISHLNYLLTTTKDINKNDFTNELTNEIQILTIRLP